MEKRKYSGRQLVLIGAVLLLVWAGYECYVRMEMLKWWFDGTMNASRTYGIPFFALAANYDAAMFNLVAYLLLLTLFSIAAIILRNRPMGDYAVLGLTVGMALAGSLWVNLFSLNLANWAQSLKVLPLLLIAIGCVINISQFYVVKSRGRGGDGGDEERDYTQMDKRQLAHQVKQHRSRRNRDVA